MIMLCTLTNHPLCFAMLHHSDTVAVNYMHDMEFHHLYVLQALAANIGAAAATAASLSQPSVVSK